MKVPFKAGNILIPQKTDMTKWSVVACDQYTSEPDYWDEVKNIVGNHPSTLNLTLPEVYLKEKNLDEKIKRINDSMDELLAEDFFREYKNSMIYLERTQHDGKVREGLIGVIDLEAYSYEDGAQSLIRATERTVVERIPPRIKIRENASLELPHILVLINDSKKEIIESLKKQVAKEDIIYDFDLMKEGGHVRGYLLNQDLIHATEVKLASLKSDDMMFAIGDGNHSLITAKACYEKLKESMKKEKYLKHPARYALVELVNLHSDALRFEAINRVIFDTDPKHLLDGLKNRCRLNQAKKGQKVEIITQGKDEIWYIPNFGSNLAVGSIQNFLDEYLKENRGKIDYIHGDKVVKNLIKKNKNSLGFIFEPIKKEELFKTITLDGVLPRKTFAMGHSYDKRYYLEARKIKL